jgi:uncharacterized protein YndB with AHSA1/START domain
MTPAPIVIGVPIFPLILVSMLGVSLVEPPASLTSPTCVACRENVTSLTNHSTPDRRTLEDGGIVVSNVEETDPSGSTRRTVEVAGLIRHPPAQVWKVLADFKTRAAWQPGAKEVTVVRVEGNRVWVDERVSFFLVGVDYRIVNTLDPEAGVIRFSLDESTDHDIAGTSGSWRLTPLPGAQQTLVTYRAWIDIGYALPDSLQAFLSKRSLPSLIERLRTEVGRRFTDPE